MLILVVPQPSVGIVAVLMLTVTLFVLVTTQVFLSSIIKEGRDE